MKLQTTIVLIVSALISIPVFAADWEIDPAHSSIGFFSQTYDDFQCQRELR